jgi:hypothetical protein
MVFGLGEYDLIFSDALGHPIRRNRFGEVWRQGMTALDFECKGPHQLRHHYASPLIQHGESVKVVQGAWGTRQRRRRSIPIPTCFLIPTNPHGSRSRLHTPRTRLLPTISDSDRTPSETPGPPSSQQTVSFGCPLRRFWCQNPCNINDWVVSRPVGGVKIRGSGHIVENTGE